MKPLNDNLPEDKYKVSARGTRKVNYVLRKR